MTSTGQGIGLNETLAAFLEGGVSVVASSAGPGNQPVLGRALGCHVSADRQHVTLFFAVSACGALLEAIAATGRVAAVVTEPSTHRSVLLKGGDARIVPVHADAADILSGHIGRFARDLDGIGFTGDFTRTLMAHHPDDITAVAFTPADLFDQTPGPKAGSRVAP